MVVAGVMPLWFWTVGQWVGIGLMVFGVVTLVLALKEYKKEKRSAGGNPNRAQR